MVDLLKVGGWGKIISCLAQPEHPDQAHPHSQVSSLLFSNKFVIYGTCVGVSVADPDPGSGAFLTPGSGIWCLFDPWIRDPE